MENNIYGPGDDDYGRDIPFWKREKEVCISCGNQTNVPINENIENRSFYVIGAGQLCESCYNKIYGPRQTNP